MDMQGDGVHEAFRAIYKTYFNQGTTMMHNRHVHALLEPPLEVSLQPEHTHTQEIYSQ